MSRPNDEQYRSIAKRLRFIERTMGARFDLKYCSTDEEKRRREKLREGIRAIREVLDQTAGKDILSAKYWEGSDV